MNAVMHVRVVFPNREVPQTDTLWNRFVRWMMEVPPNPLVWYAPCDWPDEIDSAKTTVLRHVTLVPHDERIAPERR